MEELLVAGGGLDGVADGVAEVEDHAEAGLFFVFADDVGFDADRGGYDAGEGFCVGTFFVEQGIGILFHEAEEAGVVDDAGFDAFLEPGAELGGGKGAEEVGVGEDGLGVVEAADEVFAGEEVDAGFASDGGVDLCEQGAGELDVADTAHVDGGEEAGDVADDASTEGKQEGVAVGPGGGKLLGEGFYAREALVAFAGGVEEDGGGLLSLGEGGEEGFGPEGPDLGRGDDEGAEGFAWVEPAEARVEGAQEPGSDGDVVGCGRGGDGDDGHDVSMVPQAWRGVCGELRCGAKVGWWMVEEVFEPEREVDFRGGEVARGDKAEDGFLEVGGKLGEGVAGAGAGEGVELVEAEGVVDGSGRGWREGKFACGAEGKDGGARDEAGECVEGGELGGIKVPSPLRCFVLLEVRGADELRLWMGWTIGWDLVQSFGVAWHGVVPFGCGAGEGFRACSDWTL